MSPRIAIIILNWNGKRDTAECIESLQQINYPLYEIILVDNGSTDGSISFLRRKFPYVTCIENGENLGFAEGNNRGIQYALNHGFDYLFLLNNDTLVDPEILNAFMRGVSDGPTILGAKLYLYGEPQRFDHLGGVWNGEKGEFDLVGSRVLDDNQSYETALPLDYVCGAALFAPRQIYESVGLLEPRFFLFWEESDWCYRAKRLGYTTKLCPEAKVWHKVSASFSGRPHTSYFWWRNRLLWMSRNLKKSERRHLYRTVVIPQVLKLIKLRCLKTLQLALILCFSPKCDVSAKREKVQIYRASLQGVKDYLRGRFGNAPSWVYTKRL